MAARGVADLVAGVEGIDLSTADSGRCAALLHDLRRIRGWADAIEARIGSRLGELATDDGAAPAADVVTRCGGVSAAEGRRRERRSRTIEETPGFGSALADGRIGAEHVDAVANVTAKLDDATKTSLLGEHADLLTAATSMSPERFVRHVRDRARSHERRNGLDRNHRQRNETFLSRRLDMATGMIEGRFAFHPELAEQIFSAVDRETAAMIAEGERAGDPAVVGRTVDRNRIAAEALGRLVGGGHQQARPAVADISVIVDEHTLTSGELHDRSICETGGGAELPPASVRRLLCGGVVTPIIVGADGSVLNAGRSIRHANRDQRRALRAMYRSCAFAGCDVAFDRCEIHHIEYWERRGATDLDNLIPVCARHHHVVHDGEWSLHLEPDRTLVIVRPDGHEHARVRPDLAEHRIRQRERRSPAA